MKTDYLEIRKSDLSRLLVLIYENFLIHGDELKLTSVEEKRFLRYIYNEIIYNYPYKCFKEIENENIKSGKNLSGFNQWINDILIFKNEKFTGRNIYPADMELSELRRNIILRYFVAEAAHFINKLQVDDLICNSNNPDELVYGKKHALSAFLGQHIIRKFPFKEEIKFQSQSAALDKPEKLIYEHWTPISFFRDIIWIEQPDSKKAKLFSPEEWYKILKYSYRTIQISKKEDDKLNAKGFKSKRMFSTYDCLGIKVHNTDKGANLLWEKLHQV